MNAPKNWLNIANDIQEVLSFSPSMKVIAGLKEHF